ncbi:MAG: glycosyltransferase family 39 protein [Patescibacteria group bacterium]|nr:glycosyltransferase family 39 protein [Patescibacteria group bacterium]
MNKIISKIKLNKIIIVVLLAFVLNSIGVLYAYPLLNLVEDETAIVSSVLKMIDSHSLRPNFDENYYLAPVTYIYLPFYLLYFAIFFLFGIVHSLVELKEMFLLDYANFKMILPIARFVSILAGSLSVYLVYKISKLLFKNNEKASLWAAFFTATNLILVQLSHFGRIWIIQTLAVLLATYYLSIMLSLKKDNLKHYLISGFLVALSFGTHLIGGIIYLCFLFVHYSLNKGKGFIGIFLKNKKFWLAHLVVFISTVFIYLLHPNSFYRYIGYYFKKEFISGYVSQSIVNSLIQSLSFTRNLEVLWEYGPLLVILFLISLPILFLKERKVFYFIGIFIIFYYLAIGPFLKWGQVRYILPIIPFLAIVAGYGFSYLLEHIFVKNLRNSLAVIFCLLFLFTPLYWDLSLLKPNTYVLAKNWIESNLPGGEMIINFELDNRLILNENKESLILLSEFMPKSVSARERYLLTLDEKEYPQPNYFILYRPEKMPENFLSQNQFNYLITYWWTNQENEIAKEKISKLNYNLELIQRFYPNEVGIDLTDLVNEMRQPLQLLKNIRYTGPYIEIYKIN